MKLRRLSQHAHPLDDAPPHAAVAISAQVLSPIAAATSGNAAAMTGEQCAVHEAEEAECRRRGKEQKGTSSRIA